MGFRPSIEDTIAARVEIWRGLGVDRQQALVSPQLRSYRYWFAYITAS